MTIRILQGDCREVLRTLPDASVQCVVTSPPYYGLRDYGVAGQIGLEQTPAEYVEQLVAVFREVRRVLREDGTCWLNLGDSYAANRPYQAIDNKHKFVGNDLSARVPDGLKPKDLIGIPWRVAFALQADGWWLRQDNIWAKRNCMPESVRDRTTRAHEYMFMLTKADRYFYDAVAIEEEGVCPAGTEAAKGSAVRRDVPGVNARPDSAYMYSGKRNKRSVWWIATQPFPEAHFATFPPDLIEPCILAGTSERGCCAQCGAPWMRQIAHSVVPGPKAAKTFVVDERDLQADANDQGANRQKDGHKPGYQSVNRTTGWLPSCQCEAATVPCVVLDPFGGAGTTGLVADRLGRNAVLIELNPQYADMARNRLTKDAGMFAEVKLTQETELGV